MKTMNERTKGILCLLFSAFCFCWMNIFVRMSGDLPVFQKAFFRNLVSVGVAAFALLKKRESPLPQKKTLPLLLLRSLFGTIGILCNFYAVDHLVLSNANMLNKLSPFAVLVFSFFILHETLTLPQILAVLAAFVGSLLVIKPVPSNLQLVPSLIGMTSGISAGLAYTLLRKATLRGERGPVIVLFFSVFSCLAVLPFVIAQGVPMSLTQLMWLMAAGLAAAGGQFGVTAAYSHAPGREISIFDYSQVIFAAVLGWILFGDLPDGWSFLGYAIIIGAAVALYFYNKRRARQLGAP